MVMKNYECHDCGLEFRKHDEEEPHCPACDSRSVTFEGKVPPSTPIRVWHRIEPFFNLFLRPWRFYRRREVERSTAIFLIMVLFVGMFGGYYQAEKITSVSPEVGEPGSIYMLRHPGVILGGIVDNSGAETPDGSGKPDEAPLSLSQLGLLYAFALALEFYWVGVLVAVMGWDCFKRNRKRITAVVTGAVWIPNLVLASIQIAYFRGLQFGLIGSDWVNPEVFHTSHVVLSGWLLYMLLGGLLFLPINLFSYVKRLIVMSVLQVMGVFGMIYVMKLFVFTRAGLPGGGLAGDLVLDALRFCAWPFVALF